MKVGQGSDLAIAQPITFASLKAARSAAVRCGIKVDLVSAQFPEDRVMIPAGFVGTSDLSRSCKDLHQSPRPRKLPLLKDILDRLRERPPADVYVYSNIDIAVQLGFYRFIAGEWERGTDAMVINRRTISGEFQSVDQLDEMYSEKGTSHPGKDCFVFGKRVLEHAVLGDVFIGQVPVGAVLYANLVAFSGTAKVYADEYQTFHLGDSQDWRLPVNREEALFNLREARRVLSELETVTTRMGAGKSTAIREIIANVAAQQRRLGGTDAG